jgi:sugar diacid utilization regulator
MMDINKKVQLTLVGLDGNAFSLMGAFRNQARKEGWTKEEIDEVLKECTSSDYDHLLQTLIKYCDDDGDYEEEEDE